MKKHIIQLETNKEHNHAYLLTPFNIYIYLDNRVV